MSEHLFVVAVDYVAASRVFMVLLGGDHHDEREWEHAEADARLIVAAALGLTDDQKETR